jgi:hypothetical protein
MTECAAGPPELAAAMMKPCAGAIEVWEVGRDVGNVRNNRPDWWNGWR